MTYVQSCKQFELLILLQVFYNIITLVYKENYRLFNLYKRCSYIDSYKKPIFSFVKIEFSINLH